MKTACLLLRAAGLLVSLVVAALAIGMEVLIRRDAKPGQHPEIPAEVWRAFAWDQFFFLTLPACLPVVLFLLPWSRWPGRFRLAAAGLVVACGGLNLWYVAISFDPNFILPPTWAGLAFCAAYLALLFAALASPASIKPRPA